MVTFRTQFKRNSAFLVNKITKKYMTFTENYRPHAAARPRGLKIWAAAAAF